MIKINLPTPESRKDCKSEELLVVVSLPLSIQSKKIKIFFNNDIFSYLDKTYSNIKVTKNIITKILGGGRHNFDRKKLKEYTV